MASSEKNISRQQGLSRSEGGRAFNCPRCSKLFKVPFKKRASGCELYPFEIICEHCKKDVSKQFFQALVSSGHKYRRSRMFKLAEGELNTSTALEVISADPGLTFDQALERLTLKERIFVLEFIKDFRPGAAAIRAKYSPKTASQIAAELLMKPNISVALQCFYREKRDTAKKTVDDTQKLLEDVAWTRITDVISVTQDGLTFAKNSDDWPEHVKQAVKSVKFTENANGISVEVTMHDKIAAIKLYGSQLGMFIQRKQTHAISESYENWRKRIGMDK